MNNEKFKALIIGATGKTGKRVAHRLAKAHIQYRGVSRNSETPFDWDSEETWPAALQGMNSVYLVFSPDLAVPGAPQKITRFVELAYAQGIEHIVLLSGRGEPEAQTCEQIVQQLGLDWTIVRASWFMQNFSESFLLPAILGGRVRLPVSEVKEPFIDVDDIADVVLAALTDPSHRNQLYEITGPECLTFHESVKKIGKAIGREIIFESIDILDFENDLVQSGVPGDYISLLKYLFVEVCDGRNSQSTNGVEKALGRKPRSMDVYIQNSLSIWNDSLVEPEVSNA